MSINITRAFVEDFESSVNLLTQQKGSLLSGAVSHTTVNGKSKYVEQLGTTETITRTSRHQDSPLVNSNHLRRRLDLSTEEWGDLIDDADQVRTLIDPTNAYTQSMGNAFGRAKDRIIIDALGGSAIGTNGATEIAFPATQLITTGGVIDTDDFINCLEKFNNADVDPSEQKWMALSPAGVTDMLADTEFKSADYNTLKPLASGQMVQWMGFNIIMSNLLTLTGSVRSALAWVPSGIMFGTGRDMKTEIVPRADKSFSTYVYGAIDFGAVRLEEEKVVKIDFTE